MRCLALLVVAGWLLLGCGGGEANPPASPSPAPPAAPDDAFVADVRATGIDMPTAATKSMGKTICTVLGMRLDAGHPPNVAYDQQVDSVYSTYGWTGTQAETVVAAAVRHLCPEHSDILTGHGP